MKTILKIALATFFAGLAVFGAYALSVDQTRTIPPRTFLYQMAHYQRVTINFNDANISTGQQFGAVMTNVYMNSIDCYVSTAFNAGTTNVVTLGTTKASANELSASGTIAPATPGVQHLTTAAGLGLAATTGAAGTPITLWAKYTQTGTPATAGSVTCVIEYMPNNDN